MYFIPQLGGYDCAFTCLKMLLANYNKDKNYLYLPHENRRYDFKELKEEASKYGTELLGIKVSRDELLKCKQFPMIVTLNKKKNIKHAVLLLSISKRWAKIYDPAVGKMKMNTDLFFKEFSYRALIVDSCAHIKCPHEFDSYVSKKDRIILPILQIISSACILLGTFFIADKYPVYLPVIFFSSFIVFEIIYRKSLISAMKRVDDIIFNSSFNIGGGTYLDVYRTIEKYRAKALSLTPNLIYYFIISIFITAILIINDYLNFIYVILPLLLAVVDVFVYRPLYNAKSAYISDKENEIEEVNSDEEFKAKSKEIHDKAYKVALFKYVFNYLEIGVLLVAILIVMSLTNTISITYVLFYLCISIFLQDQFKSILECGKDIEEKDLAKAKLINSINRESNN